MKKLSYLLLLLLSVITYGCAETEQPYVGYIAIERAVLEPTANSTVTVTADTDISSPIIVETKEGAEWCTVTVKGKEIIATANSANTDSNYRSATLKVRCGYRETTFTVLQKFEGQQYLQYDWSGWDATGNSVETGAAGDNGGYSALFTEDQSDYWHSVWSTGTVPLPYILIIDMKKDLDVVMFQIGRRHYPANGNYYPSIKTMNIYTSTDDKNYEKVGGFTFTLPWTAPDGTIVKGNSPLIPAYEEIKLDKAVTARYVKLEITESNAGGAAQIGFFKAFQKV